MLFSTCRQAAVGSAAGLQKIHSKTPLVQRNRALETEADVGQSATRLVHVARSPSKFFASCIRNFAPRSLHARLPAGGGLPPATGIPLAETKTSNPKQTNLY